MERQHALGNNKYMKNRINMEATNNWKQQIHGNSKQTETTKYIETSNNVWKQHIHGTSNKWKHNTHGNTK